MSSLYRNRVNASNTNLSLDPRGRYGPDGSFVSLELNASVFRFRLLELTIVAEPSSMPMKIASIGNPGIGGRLISFEYEAVYVSGAFTVSGP